RNAPRMHAASDQWNRRTSGSQTLTVRGPVSAWWPAADCMIVPMAASSVLVALLDHATIGGVVVDLDLAAGAILAVDLVAAAGHLELVDGVAGRGDAVAHGFRGQPLAAGGIGAPGPRKRGGRGEHGGKGDGEYGEQSVHCGSSSGGHLPAPAFHACWLMGRLRRAPRARPRSAPRSALAAPRRRAIDPVQGPDHREGRS